MQVHSSEGWSSPAAALLANETPHGEDEARSRCARAASTRQRRGASFGFQRMRQPLDRGEAERALMLAVLVDAARCLAGQVSPIAERRKIAARTRQWVRCREVDWLFSFESICHCLDLDPGRLRALLLCSRATAQLIADRLGEYLEAR